MKRLNFLYGNDFTCWLQHIGILKNHTDVKREEYRKLLKKIGCKNLKDYEDLCARRLGYNDKRHRNKEYNLNHIEYKRERRWNNGVCSPFSENED